MYVFIIIMAGILGILVAGKNMPNDGKRGVLKYFYQAGHWIHELAEQFLENKASRYFKGNSAHRDEVKKDIGTLYPTDREKEHEKSYYAEKIAIVLMILLIGSFLGVVITVQMNTQDIFQENRLKRPEYGEDSQNVTLSAKAEDDAMEIEIDVKDQKYSPKEARELLEKAAKELENVILGENPSVDEVRTDLNFVGTLQDGKVSVEYELDDYEYVDTDGKLAENIPKEGVLVQIAAELSYEQQKYQSVFDVCLLPPILTKEEQRLADLKEAVGQKDEESQYEQWQSLPEEVDGASVLWEKRKDKSGWMFLGISILCAVLIYYGKDSDLKKSIEQRNQQMLRDYPEIVSKLTLFLQAGMTVLGAWGKMISDYENRKQKNPEKMRYVYEEMLYTYREIQDGVSETDAYLRFGKRCRIQKYMKFSTLLVQNLRKGSGGLISMLEYEAQDAYEERKNMAKRAGEEAGTKLLFPMLLMLSIVMVIMIVPAFLSFQM